MIDHTPGPWYFGKYADRVTLTPDSDGTDSICHIYGGRNQRDNAKLISLAPSLLRACELGLQRLESGNEVDRATARGMRQLIEP